MSERVASAISYPISELLRVTAFGIHDNVEGNINNRGFICFWGRGRLGYRSDFCSPAQRFGVIIVEQTEI